MDSEAVTNEIRSRLAAGDPSALEMIWSEYASDLLGYLAALHCSRNEAEDTLQAIREGSVDAVVVSGPKGEQVFTLTGEDVIYRRLVETMNEAGLMVMPQGVISFCNERFTKILKRPMEEIVGQPLE